jgi:hypothetical protein
MGNCMRYLGDAAGDNATVIETGDVSRYREFTLQATDGATDVFVSLNGTDYSTAALSLIDLGATTSDPVLVTAADRTYAFFGRFAKVKILQNGGTAVTGCALICGE